MTPVQKYMRLNLKTNDSHINQSQNWRMRSVKYFGALQSKQIRKWNTKDQIL